MEKVALQDEGLVPTERDAPKYRRSSPRNWPLLFLLTVVASGWLLWPCCHHVQQPISIEDRVERILKQTPLIGKLRV